MDPDIKAFIDKLLQIPTRVRQGKICALGSLYFVKCSVIADYLSVVYKIMPTSLRTARKKGMRMSYKSFMYLDRLDKMFLSKTFPNNVGYAIVNMRELQVLLDDLCKLLPKDDAKLQQILGNQ